MTKLKKWYANAHNSGTLRMVKASSEEEARKKFEEIFGNEDFYFGERPQKVEPKITAKEMQKYTNLLLGL